MKLALGIDFGTTNSCAALVQGHQARVIPNMEGQNTTPSIVGLLDNGERVVGIAAKRQAIANPKRTIASIKRFLGRTMSEVVSEQEMVSYQLKGGKNQAVRIIADGKELEPERIAAWIIGKLKADIEEHVDQIIEDAVITVPAYFNDAQRQAVKDAASIAGLNVMRLINEPTAAALAYGYDGQLNAGKIMVFDLGGGTFDVSILEIEEGVFDVLGTSGDNHLGGDNFDKMIVDWLKDICKSEASLDISEDAAAMQRLWEAAEKAKIELSSTPQTEINLPFLASSENGPYHLQAPLSRATLQMLIAPLLDRLSIPVKNCLKAAKVSREEIKDIILVGGMTRMPAVQERVSTLLGADAHRGINPDEAVALGAAIQASILLGEIKNIDLLDVTPLSLGLELTDGTTERIIPANSRVPRRAKGVFSTSIDNQTSVEIRVVQGERSLARDNRLLGRVQLIGIPPAPRGTPDIEVTFAIDGNGLLIVAAHDLKSNSDPVKVKIESTTGLDAEDIDRMRAEASRFVESDRRTRALADIRNQAELLQGELASLLKDPLASIDPQIAQSMQDALTQLHSNINLASSPEEITEIQEQLTEIIARLSKELSAKTKS